jgi:hypothetical protein
VDFVGQKAPTSKFSLILLDLTILGIQCFMLAVYQECERLRKTVLPAGRHNPTRTAASESTAPVQDLDAEERGILRDGLNGELETNETTDIEMRPMSTSPAREGDDNQESSGLLESSSATGRSAPPDLLSVLRSGNAVLADLHVVHTMRSAGNDYQSAAAYSLQTIGYRSTLAALAAQRRARLATQRRPH